MRHVRVHSVDHLELRALDRTFQYDSAKTTERLLVTTSIEASTQHRLGASVRVAALGFIVWAVGFLGLAASGTAAQWEWALAFLGPLILAIAVLMRGAFVRGRYGVGALVSFVLALVIQAAVFLPRTLGIDVVGPGGTSFSYDAWGLAWIVGALGVLFVMRSKQSMLPTFQGATFVQLSMLLAGMLLYGVGFVELGSDRLNHEFGFVTFAGAVLIALSVIAQRKVLAQGIGAPAAGICVLIAAVWAIKDVARVIGNAMTDATFAKEMVFGVEGVLLVLAVVGCALAARHLSQR